MAFEDLSRRIDAIDAQMANPAVLGDAHTLRRLGRERADLAALLKAAAHKQKLEEELKATHSLLHDAAGDVEMVTMASEEALVLEKALAEAKTALRELLLPKDPLDNLDVVLEIRAGAGGEEAALFAADLHRMYLRYAERMKWKVEPLDFSPSETGGLKEVICSIEGVEVHRFMKFEGGVHRVQRVPRTESQGRIHTSAATVAVLPQTEEEDEVDIPSTELRIDVFRASGPGGQSVNTTDSAVRITHLPTGITAQSQDEKSQHKNKSKALKTLKARLFERMRQEQEQAETAKRRAMVGSGDRSERIRTYNFPQGRITDHRIGLTLHKLDKVLDGEMRELTEALLKSEREALLLTSEGGRTLHE